jgi:hypothetical protein
LFSPSTNILSLKKSYYLSTSRYIYDKVCLIFNIFQWSGLARSTIANGFSMVAYKKVEALLKDSRDIKALWWKYTIINLEFMYRCASRIDRICKGIFYSTASTFWCCLDYFRDTEERNIGLCILLCLRSAIPVEGLGVVLVT